MTDGNLNRPAPVAGGNSARLRRTTAGKLKTTDAEELRDVTATDLEEMYKPEKNKE